ncbi:hypothetical protein K440DRAFT_660271 [Wilcoxina mikolae CBS 423.85]|nr:hypothetical protein K440DRAFT_660271 [Wilcoxina mikolae CBS 423.85]
MSEYWKSIPKYWCKHCKDFVTDTTLGRKNHDATAKHQSALKRFLRDLHRDNERAISATENAKREVARLNALVSGSSSSSPVPTPAVAKPQQTKGERWGVANRELTAEEKKRQMKELEALGVAMPEAFRGDLALPGEWTTVSVEEAKAPLTEKELLQKELAEASQKEKEEAERKRKWDELDEDDKEIRSFKIQERTYPGTRDGEDVDVAALFAKKGKGKAKVEPKVEDAVEDKKPFAFRVKKDEDEGEGGDEVKGEDIKKEPEESPLGITTKAEESEDRTMDVKKEDEPPAGEGVVFKKRKVKTMRKK